MYSVLFNMRNRGSPWKWPLCIGLAFALVLVTVYWVPQAWIDAFFSPLSLDERWLQDQGPRWGILLEPPPDFAADDQVDSSPKPHEPQPVTDHLDPDWWVRGVAIRTVTDPGNESSQDVPDSVMLLLTALGLERDFMARARPDSVLASRLFMMQVEGSFRFDELKPYLSAMARSRCYADIMSRKADMYDEFLSRTIMTPD